MQAYLLHFQETDKTKLALTGGKGANLGELSRIEGIRVPPGFCVTTKAYKELTGGSEAFNTLLKELSGLKADDRKAIAGTSAKIRQVIEAIVIPPGLRDEVALYIAQLGENDAYAVRSSATAEDLPTASFAGQQDTYLNIISAEAILKHISKCWASLFTERAVTYRLQNGFEHNKAYLAVVIQKMVFPDAAGIMFTADPVTGNRRVLSVDAGFGLGEAMVSGLVNADNYKVRHGALIDKKIPAKKLAVYALKGGGTQEQQLAPELQNRQVLIDEQIIELERIGRKIEQHFGRPQDIEWCLADGAFYIVQSRPITTLYPIPAVNDGENHVYVSVGHQQMMTDAIKPLGLSLFQLTMLRPMFTAGGRLFVDVAPNLATTAGRHMLINVLGKSDPLIKDALTTIIERGDFIKPVADDGSNSVLPQLAPREQIETDPEIVAGLIKSNQSSVAELKQNIQAKSGAEVFDFILEDIPQLKKVLFDPRSTAVIMAALDAYSWLNEYMSEWLGEKNAGDVLSQSVDNNVTSEMGLALLGVADIMRPYPAVVEYLQQVRDEDFLSGMDKLKGGPQSRLAIDTYLNKYGMRCAGEIDITKTRWSESPKTLFPIILSNIKNFEPNAGAQKFEQGRQEAVKKELDLLQRLKQLPGGQEKAAEAKQKIAFLRNFIGYREYPKYGMISRYFVYKQAMLKEAAKLVQAGIIPKKEDIYYLTFQELREAVENGKVDSQLISQRKEEHKIHEKLNPPRVFTSEGEIITGSYKPENLPVGAIAGLAVSSGVIEGRARVILKMEDANIEEGDILITTFTDPSWTPLFVSIKGLVTEVGGLMTHGAVVAREYGLPAVVGVEDATKLIQDGQRIRVNGTDGYVEIL